MIKFFKKIRQKLLSENPPAGRAGKFGKYLTYAIGEIVLVVIGILIALSINNWNNNQQNKKTEQTTLKALLSEFHDNSVSINNYLEDIKRLRKYGDTLKKLIKPELTTLSEYNVHRLMGEVATTTKSLVSTDALEDARASGRLNLLDDAEIRQTISKWSSKLKDLQAEEFDWAQEFSNQFVPFTNKWIQWENVDYILNKSDSIRYNKSRFDKDPRLMLQQPEFENIMNIQYWRFTRIENKTKELLQVTNDLTSLLENELK